MLNDKNILLLATEDGPSVAHVYDKYPKIIPGLPGNIVSVITIERVTFFTTENGEMWAIGDLSQINHQGSIDVPIRLEIGNLLLNKLVTKYFGDMKLGLFCTEKDTNKLIYLWFDDNKIKYFYFESLQNVKYMEKITNQIFFVGTTEGNLYSLDLVGRSTSLIGENIKRLLIIKDYDIVVSTDKAFILSTTYEVFGVKIIEYENRKYKIKYEKKIDEDIEDMCYVTYTKGFSGVNGGYPWCEIIKEIYGIKNGNLVNILSNNEVLKTINYSIMSIYRYDHYTIILCISDGLLLEFNCGTKKSKIIKDKDDHAVTHAITNKKYIKSELITN